MDKKLKERTKNRLLELVEDTGVDFASHVVGYETGKIAVINVYDGEVNMIYLPWTYWKDIATEVLKIAEDYEEEDEEDEKDE